MKRIKATLLFIFILWIAAGIESFSQPKDQLTQAATIDALLAGAYDGIMNIDEFENYGNFGLGTFDKLDGEMIVLDGNVYQARYDGKVIKNDGPATTPFVTLVNFEPDTSFGVSDLAGFSELVEAIYGKISNKNLPVAVKVTGSFSYVKVRSVPAQEKPYKPLNEVVKNQAEFEYENLEGTIVGFVLPQYFKSFNAGGFHLHFLSKDETKGGHILDVKLQNGEVELDKLNKFFVYLPDDSEYFNEADLAKDRSEELENVEK